MIELTFYWKEDPIEFINGFMLKAQPEIRKYVFPNQFMLDMFLSQHRFDCVQIEKREVAI